MRVFLDTNILLDIAFGREGVIGSTAVLEKCETEQHEVRVAWHTLSNIFYILGRDRGAQMALAFVRHLFTFSEVAPVGNADALWAAAAGLPDFEDALQLSAARACGATVLITRNKDDFGNPADMRVLTPEEFLTV